MPEPEAVASHYTLGNLTEAIEAGLEKMGKGTHTISMDDLAPVDEFHIGGRAASEDFIPQLGFSHHHNVLDVGCGLGGTARFAAVRTGCRITGLDLTPELVETGNILSEWVGMENRVDLLQGSALEMPFPENQFDGAMMLHVAMNLSEKERLCAEVARVLRPGSIFGIYDIMRVGKGELTYPAPWATEAATCAISEPHEYRRALISAGFEIIGERNRQQFAIEFFAARAKRLEADGGPRPLGLHITMGPDAQAKIANMVRDVGEGRIAQVEMIARLPG